MSIALAALPGAPPTPDPDETRSPTDQVSAETDESTDGSNNDAPLRSRRRGAHLEAAILAATAAELIEFGYAGLTMEGVAARAHTGKASVYRRWPGKQHLVLDALVSQWPGTYCPGDNTAALPPGTTTRDAFVIIGVQMADLLRGPAGQLVASIAGQASRDPDLARLLEEQMFGPRCDGVMELLRRGVERGEVRPEAVAQVVASVGPAMILHQLFSVGTSPDRAWIIDVVDQVLMPAIRPVS